MKEEDLGGEAAQFGSAKTRWRFRALMHVKIDYWCSPSNVMHDVHVVLALSTRPFINASGCVRACISRAPGAALARVRPAASRLRRGRIQKQAHGAHPTWASTAPFLQPAAPALSQAA